MCVRLFGGILSFVYALARARTLVLKSRNLVPINLTLEEVERRHILNALEQSNWKVSGPGGAAERLNLNPSTLRSRMSKHLLQLAV